MRTSQSDTESVASPTAALKRELEGVEAQLRGLADRRTRVEAELLRIKRDDVLAQATAPSTDGIFAAKHGEDLDEVKCSPEVEVASSLAPTGLHVSRSPYLLSGWIDKLNCFNFWEGDTVCT